jgi:hypothetical protein
VGGGGVPAGSEPAFARGGADAMPAPQVVARRRSTAREVGGVARSYRADLLDGPIRAGGGRVGVPGHTAMADPRPAARERVGRSSPGLVVSDLRPALTAGPASGAGSPGPAPSGASAVAAAALIVAAAVFFSVLLFAPARWRSVLFASLIERPG